MLLSDLDMAGQQALATARVVIIGCGALGTVAAELLARAGAGLAASGGELRLVDRDVVERSNLHRQVLFDDADASAGVPKAIAAAAAIARINPDVHVTPIVADCTSRSILDVVGETRPTVILDGTDNFETRFLLNDVAVMRGVPMIYAGAVGTRGMLATILPAPAHGVTTPWTPGPCLRCLIDAPAPGTTETCDTVGILGPVSAAAASFQAIEAIKIITERFDLVRRHVLAFDPWRCEFSRLAMDEGAQAHGCPCCGARRFEFLDAPTNGSAVLCGSDAVQITPKVRGTIDLEALATRLAGVGAFEATPWMVRGEVRKEQNDQGNEPLRLSVFGDGRAIVHGTRRVERARAVYAKLVGS